MASHAVVRGRAATIVTAALAQSVPPHALPLPGPRITGTTSIDKPRWCLV